MDIETIKNAYTDHYTRHGFEILPSSPLVHEQLPTAFVMSVGLLQLEPVLATGDPSREWRDFAMIQRCIRHFDMEHVGSGDRLSFFEMAGAITDGTRSIREIIETLHAFLFGVLDLDPRRVFFTVFGGGRFNGSFCPADEDTPKALAALGVAPDHVLTMGVDENLFGTVSREEFCGPSLETFVDRGLRPHTTPHDCRPGCRCGRYVEIGNTVLLKYRKSDSALMPLSRTYVESALGVERTAFATSDQATLHDLQELRMVRETILENFPSSLGGRCAYVCADHLRAIAYAVADGARPGHGGRRHVLRKLIRRFLVHLGDPRKEFKSALRESTLSLAKSNNHVMRLHDADLCTLVSVILQEKDIFENGSADPARYFGDSMGCGRQGGENE